MAANLWGKVYYKDIFAGILAQEPGNRCVFTYDSSYLANANPAIAHTLPVRAEPHLGEDGLHPFFDNLVAEGWLRDAQARALGVRKSDRMALLLAFGADCAGAVSVIDPEPVGDINIDLGDPRDIAAIAGRASLSGIQPKIAVVREGRGYRPAAAGEQSTHIAKLPSGSLTDIPENEYVTTLACQALLRGDEGGGLELGSLPGISDSALFIKRFDRTDSGEKIHFEEFNQLLGKPSADKYQGSYEDMADFILANGDMCLKTDTEKLYRRILACLLVGNTDAHFKNFAMFHTAAGLRLTPAYDLVASGLYKEYQTLALGIERAENMRLGDLKPKTIARLGLLFQLPKPAIRLALEDLEKRLPKAHDAITKAEGVRDSLKQDLNNMIEKRWNGTFASTGAYLSKKQ